MHLEKLDAFGHYDFAVHALGGNKADLTVGGIKLIQTLNGSAGTVCNPVVLEVTVGDGISAGRHDGDVRTGKDVVTEQLVRLTRLDGGLPQILSISLRSAATVESFIRNLAFLR